MERLRHLGLVVAGGMIGSLLRYLAVPNPGDVPWALFGVNLVGAATAGWLMGRIQHHSHRARWLIPLAVIGTLGALTTFSGLAVAVFLLVDVGRWGEALAFGVASLACGPVVAAAGLRLGARQ